MPTPKTFNTLESAVIQLAVMVRADPKSNWLDGTKVKRQIYPARYDLSAINNISRQIERKVPLTDRQQILTIKLVTKYRKQWKKKGYDVSNIDLNTPTEFAIRKSLDREQSVSVNDNIVSLKFPYKPRLINLITEFAQHSCGRIEWNKETRVWNIAATAGNMAWLDKFVNDHKFKQDSSYESLIELMKEAYDYKNIQLDIVNDELVLHDAPATMLTWIKDHIGSMDISNFIQIVSSSSLLEFTLSDNIIQYTIDNHEDIADILLMRRTFINSDETALLDVLQKVNKLQFEKIVMFIPDNTEAGNYIRAIRKAMPDYNVVAGDPGMAMAEWKTVYVTTKAIAVQPELIISLAGFMAGPNRRRWFDLARKNIYYCQDIDNKIKKQLKKDESDIKYKRRDEC